MRWRVAFALGVGLVLGGCAGFLEHPTIRVDTPDGFAGCGQSHRPAQALATYWGPESPPRGYTKLALLEVQGTQGATVAAMQVLLLERARQCGADAVVGVTKGYVTAQTPHILPSQDKGDDDFEALLLSGIAVTLDPPAVATDAWPD